MEEKKNGKGLVVVLVLFILISLGLGGYIVYDKFINQDTNKTIEDSSKKEIENSEAKEDISENDSKKYCEGTYTYNDGISVGDGNIHKQTYILNNDGTFSSSTNDITKEEGTYIIKDDTIVFIYHPETYGGEDIASYTSSSYYISSDCSYMSYENHNNNGDSVTIKLSK